MSEKADGSMSSEKNIESFLRGISVDNLVRAGLIHGNKVKMVDSVEESPVQGADGLITMENIYLGVTVADCLPIFIMGDGFHGVLHAGWRGLHSGIIEESIKKMPNTKCSIHIGPAIGECHFEVSNDFKDKFKGYEDCFDQRREGLFLNLKKVAETKFREGGVKKVSTSQECTFCNHNFFSYRRDKKKNIMLAIVGPADNNPIK